jgi:hypothetical protein
MLILILILILILSKLSKNSIYIKIYLQIWSAPQRSGAGSICASKSKIYAEHLILINININNKKKYLA